MQWKMSSTYLRLNTLQWRKNKQTLCTKFIENWPSGYREDQIVNSSPYEDKSYNKGQILIKTAILTLRLRRAKIKHNSCGIFFIDAS